MNHKRTLFLLLAAYVVGNILLIVIQYNWAKNLNTLIRGNENLIEEFAVTNRLKELERDVLSVESRIRGTITTEDTAFIHGMPAEIQSIQSGLTALKGQLGNDSAAQYIALLDQLVQDKLAYSHFLLDTYNAKGKEAAEMQIATQHGKRLTDSILLTGRNIELARRRHLLSVTTAIDNSGTNALNLGIILLGFVLVSAAFVFWYLINTIRQQNSLIHQLHDSEKKVREAATIKENFLANMSHEIRTPMNAILGFANLLYRKKTFDEEALQYVQTIQRSGENLLAIVNDILDLSKIEAGMMRIEAAPFSLRGLVHSVETMFRPKAAEKKLHLQTLIDESLPDHLEGDAVRLTQILVNLVGNAIKFTHQGSITLDVKKQTLQGQEVHIVFAVADTGIGIAKEKLAAVFERFQQAENSFTRQYGGTGLGLAIVHDLVTLQQGTIKVESEPGRGTVFSFIIPYRLAAEQPAPAPTAATPSMQHHSLLGLRVLVVEDHPINQSLLQNIFRHWQVECKVATNGQEAIDCLQQHAFDVVLMDIQMPLMDGYAATEKIRELGMEVPIIAMTAHAMAGEREKCLQHGMNDYLPKPVREAALYNVLRPYANFNGTTESSATLGQQEILEGFRYIDLSYMKEVSACDTAYEKLVTEQFLEAMPVDLAAMEEAWQQRDELRLRSIAHNMKTTISVMGLKDRLQPHLDALEYDKISDEHFQYNFSVIKEIGDASLKEAKEYYRSFD